MRFNPLKPNSTPIQASPPARATARTAKPARRARAATPEPETGELLARTDLATLRTNPTKGGLEIKFPIKPDDAVLAPLKAARPTWKWSRFGQLWYTADTPESRLWAKDFLCNARCSVEPAAPSATTNSPIPKSTNPVPAKPDATLTLSEQIHEAWLRESRLEERTRFNFSQYYLNALLKAGKKPVVAQYDEAGNCRLCGESGRCPGWHYEGEFPNRTMPAAPRAPIYIPPLPPMAGMTPLGLPSTTKFKQPDSPVAVVAADVAAAFGMTHLPNVRIVPPVKPMVLVDKAPPGGWTDADRVPDHLRQPWARANASLSTLNSQPSTSVLAKLPPRPRPFAKV